MQFSRTRDARVFSSPFCAGYWKCAAAELKDLRVLIFAALIIAIRVALKSVYIPVGENVNIYVGFIFTALGGSVYGPVVALIVGMITDLLGVAFFPVGPFHPAWTLLEMFTTFLYALGLYRQKITFGRIFLTKFSVNFLGNILGESALMAALYGKGIFAYLAIRVLKNVIMLPFEVIILSLIFGALMIPLTRLKIYAPQQNALKLSWKHYVILGVITAVAVLLSVFALLNYETCKETLKTFFASLKEFFAS